MRWEILFDDLQSQLEAAERDLVDAEVMDLAEAEMATIPLVDRLRAAMGRRLRLGVEGLDPVTGVVRDAGAGWLLIGDPHRQVVVATAAIRTVAPLAEGAPPAGPVGSRLGLGHALRALARAGEPVQVALRDGQRLQGWLVRVGADHVDLHRDATGADLPVLTVPFAALAAVVSS